MEPDNFILYFVILIGFAVLLFEMSMLRSFYSDESNRDKKLKDRLQELKSKTNRGSSQSIVKGAYENQSKLAFLPFYSNINTLIIQSGGDTTVARILIQAVVLAAIGWFICFEVTNSVGISILCAMAVLWIPIIVLKHKKNSRLLKFNEQFGDAVDIIIRGLKAGHPFESALNLAATELPNPVAEELAITHAEMTYGVPISTAMQNLLDRVNSEPLKSLVTSVVVQKETGGNLAEILEKISGVIRAGHRFQRKLKTLSAEGKMSAWVLGAIPPFIAVYYFATHPEFMVYMTDYEMGHDLIKTTIVLYIVGTIWVKHVIKIEP